MTKRYDGAIEALDEAGKTGSAEAVAAARWKQRKNTKVQQNTAQRQQLEVAYQQTCGAIAALYEFAPLKEGEGC